MRYAVVRKGNSYKIVPVTEAADKETLAVLEANSWEEAYDAASQSTELADMARADLMRDYQRRKQIEEDVRRTNREQVQQRERSLEENLRYRRYYNED